MLHEVRMLSFVTGACVSTFDGKGQPLLILQVDKVANGAADDSVLRIYIK